MSDDDPRFADLTPEDKVAAKLVALIDLIANHQISEYGKEGLAKEVIADLKAIMTPAPPKPSRLREQDVLVSVYMGDGIGVRIVHKPTGIALTRHDVASQLQAKSEMFEELEKMLEERQWQPPQ